MRERTHRVTAARSVVESVLGRLGVIELERTYLCGAVVERSEDHFRICSGHESESEAERAEARRRGRCDCGAPLSISFRRVFCRACEV